MAKVKTIEEKRKEMEKALARLSAFEQIINKAESEMHWNYCSIRKDDDGNPMHTDDERDFIWDYPTPEDYRYEDYIAYKSALDEIKALV